ncbi:hypothetical protein MF271_07800 [Deinococcus sp. KNUC1210]|uniref:hypothetical protein n=1 Tax=Deinococcus sp. KNUC1210 TaxID=2917691 RepID=UPI001EF0F00F|nr:hypothetical protein [Deinococcus sp. KNUC1210]ULH16472.1 hypothetical protein MF271_07800 [Deinococcus sp. KNUC1210]
MKKLLLISMFLGATSACSSASAASTLLSNLPSGALATFETNHMSAAIDRANGLLNSALKVMGGKNAQMDEMNDMLSLVMPALKGSVGTEGVLGVFAVSGKHGTFEPGVLAVTRLNADARALLKSTMPTTKKPARVGAYTFVRSDDMFVGMSQNLAYAASDKNLLMSYLGRLSGKAAPRLEKAPAYAVPMNAVGTQELRAYFNFSAIAKVVRSQLATVGFPRLVAPVVDAIDTLGQVGAGISTNAAGLSGTSALAANAGGADKSLYSILTHNTEAFNVQSVIPANAESVTVSACDPLTNEYTARWLTRLDLFDPTGFLSDTQLAHNLEVQGRYLGDECAQVMLAGSMKASLSGSGGTMNHSVTYQKVTDEDAARAHMQDFAASVNTSLQAALKATRSQLGRLGGLDPEMGRQLGSLNSMLSDLARLKFVYDFKEGYLVTAFNQKALDSAMQATSFLADSPDFQAQNFALSGSGFQFSRPPATPYTKADLLRLFQAAVARSNLGAMYDKKTQQMLQPAAAVLTDLLNRYGGSGSQTSATENLVVTKSNINFRW